jgi:PAS domain S-box-containing protein
MKADLQFPQLPDASPRPILITNAKEEIYYVNPAWEKLTGYTFDEVKGKNPRFLGSGRTPRKLYLKMKKTLQKGKPFNSEEFIDRKKNGKEYQIHALFFPIQKNGENLYYVQMLHDISQKKETEKKKDAFISIASHELKTPVTTLSAYTQILEKRLEKTADSKEMYFIKNIKLQTQRLTNLINDLLNVNRIESGKMTFHFKEFDLNELVQRVVIDFQYTSDKYVISREGVIPGKVRGDEDHIEEVLINLLTNAVKYSPKANKIMIKLSDKENQAVVSVEDYGIGIKRKDISHIFERFYRTKDKDDGRIPGFGLGLYICSQIIKRHKGKIWVKSIKGKGSTFSFSLPLVRD